MKKFFLALLACTCAVIALVSCSNTNTYEIAVVTDVGQLNDGGFNQGTWEGAVAYAKKAGKSYKYYQPANGSDATDNDRVAAMNRAIEGGAKVIVTPGFLQAAAITTVATANPDVKFIFVDGWAMGLANVTAITYKEHESGYFAGYAAVMDGFTKLGGTFGGGAANYACNRFAHGFVQGAAAAALAKDATVEVKVSFQYGDTFSASNELQSQISGWYSTGTEAVFSCGGSMVNSVIAAAKANNNQYVIGVDVDQASLYEKVLTSAFKGLSTSVEQVLTDFYAGNWDTKLSDKAVNLGAAENATGLPTATASWRFRTFTVAQYNELFAQVVAGTLTIDGSISNTPAEAKATIAAAGNAKCTVTVE